MTGPGGEPAGLLTLGETMALAAGPTGHRLVHAPGLSLGIGGAESNVAIGVRRLGLPAVWVGRVGSDPLGDLVVRELRAEELDLQVVRHDAPTGLMVKERAHGHASSITYYRRASAGSHLAPGDVDEALVAAAAVVHVTGITPGLGEAPAAAVEHVVDLAGRHGRPISFDVNHRHGVWRGRDPRPTYRRLAARAAVVFAGDDEARLLTGSTTADAELLLSELAEHCGGDVVLKLGDAGALARIDGQVLNQPAVPVTAVDTVGAGDAFVAGYLAEDMLGRDAAERLATAATCGAFACLSAGDWEGYPRRTELEQLTRTEAVRR